MIYMSLIIFTIALIIMTNYFSRFPGDLALANGIQYIIGNIYGWANYISKLAEYPWYFLLLIFSCVSSFLITKNPRIALISVLSFGGIWVLDKMLKTIIIRPRPSSNLIHVSQHYTSSSFPSTTALIFGATLGFIIVSILIQRNFSFPNIILMTSSVIILILVFIARIILGAHWPSDILISYLISFLWIIFLFRFV